MNNQLLHTPEGVRDIYSSECEKKIFIQNAIHKVIKSYGYDDIQTPTFEYFDIFAKERGSVESKNMYKFFDREGYTLVLRPDITPSIARAVSKYYSDFEMPIRLSYTGNTFINNSEYQGKLKEVTQTGAELIGDNKSDADGEIIALCINCLLECGLRDFQVEAGHVDFLSGILEEADIQKEIVDEFKHLLKNKNYFGIEELLSKCDIESEIKELLIKLPEMTGQEEVLKEAFSMVKNPKSINALDRLQKVYNILCEYGYEKYISFDLGMVSNYNYYTGIILKAYTYGTGDAIVTGGRYDNLLMQFGKNSPSIGFGINVDNLLTAMNRQNIVLPAESEKIIIVYDNEHRIEAMHLAWNLRNNGERAELICKSSKHSKEDYANMAKNNNGLLKWLV